MSGERQIEVKASGTESVEITISRLVARARLVKVTNNLASGYGPVKIKYVMLRQCGSQSKYFRYCQHYDLEQ